MFARHWGRPALHLSHCFITCLAISNWAVGQELQTASSTRTARLAERPSYTFLESKQTDGDLIDESGSPKDVERSQRASQQTGTDSGADQSSEESSRADLSKTESTRAGTTDSESKSANLLNSDSQASKESKDRAKESIAPMLNRELSARAQAVSISLDKIGTGLLPQSTSSRKLQTEPLPTGLTRGMYFTPVYWKPTLIQHYPLYFEDAMLERHGHSRCCWGSELTQSVVSGAKFFATIPLLPYHETLRSKHQCVYALGHYRPGSAAPCLQDSIPYDGKALVVQSASVAAFFWAMPL